MEAQKPPIRIINPGKTYRQDSDATHSPMFHQWRVSSWTPIQRRQHALDPGRVLQGLLRGGRCDDAFPPSFFPFTEPSSRWTSSVTVPPDRSSSYGEGTDWMEILGCGMVHPNVLRAGGLDPDVYQGFAWGMGLDRIAMLKYACRTSETSSTPTCAGLAYYGFRPLDMPTLFGGLSA